MEKLSTRLVRIIGALLLGVAVAGAPGLTYADGHFGGGGHSLGGGHFGGGGHSMGGGHFGGGGHSMGGGHSAGGGHFFGGGHFGAAHVSAPHFSAGQVAGTHFAAAHGYSGAHFGAPHFAAAAPGARGPAHGAFPNVSALHAAGRPGSGFVSGWHGGPAWGSWHGWNGGYWNGVWWPHVYFGAEFSWFLPVLPFGYATYWWGGMPYYYWNNLYYTYSPADNGYMVTDPPPVAGSTAGDGTYSDGASAGYDAAQSGGGAGDVYLYPRNGQSEEQTQNDRYECHSWAVSQSGFDPTRGSNSGNRPDYRRAMIACLDARGYSAR